MSCLKLVVAERGSMDNANAGIPILILVFVVLSIVAIVGGKPAKWKLYNLLIILGGCAFGTGFGALPMRLAGVRRFQDTLPHLSWLSLALPPLTSACGATVSEQRLPQGRIRSYRTALRSSG
jgi:hypothetical protein